MHPTTLYVLLTQPSAKDRSRRNDVVVRRRGRRGTTRRTTARSFF